MADADADAPSYGPGLRLRAAPPPPIPVCTAIIHSSSATVIAWPPPLAPTRCTGSSSPAPLASPDPECIAPLPHSLPLLPRRPPSISRLMGDHLALLVDRLLTESMLDAAIESRKQVADLQAESVAIDYCCDADGSSAGRMVECMICQEDDWDSSMEAPCVCCGSLKIWNQRLDKNPWLFNGTKFRVSRLSKSR